MLLERWETRSRSIHQSRNDVKGKMSLSLEGFSLLRRVHGRRGRLSVCKCTFYPPVSISSGLLPSHGIPTRWWAPRCSVPPFWCDRRSVSSHLFETRTTLWIRWFTQPCVDARVCWRRAISNAPSISSNPTSSTTCLTTRETRPSSVGGTSTSLSSGSCGRLRYFKEFSDNFILNNKRAEILALKKK